MLYLEVDPLFCFHDRGNISDLEINAAIRLHVVNPQFADQPPGILDPLAKNGDPLVRGESRS